MGKERRINQERGLKRKSRHMDLSSDDSDEDYVAEHEENTSEEEELKNVEAPLGERNSRNKNVASNNVDHVIDFDNDSKTEEENSKDDDDDDASIEEEIEEEEELDEELVDEEEDDDDEFTIEEEDEDTILEEDDDADDENYTSKTKVCSKVGHKKNSRKLGRKALCPRPKKRRAKKSKKNDTKGYKVKRTCYSKSKRVKNKSSQGRKRSRFDSNSESDSDFDYTISEEEREQVKEANKFCGGLITNARILPSKKKIEENGTVKRKGKEKASEENFVCGVCLSEEDKRRSKGTLDCCTHSYCFTCIMEWAKVESRCPLCKQRFKTITKHGRSANGVDLRNVVIDVPERDQVYQPTEEEIRSFVDPYENVICTECHEGGDDGLMLLCDICDSPAHTYCVGLGRQVPEGNWYCDVCRQGALEAPNSLQDQRPSRTITSPNGGESSGLEFWPPSLRYQGIAATSPVAGGAGAATLSGRRQILRHIQHLISIRQGPLLPRAEAAIQTTSFVDDLVEGPHGASSTQPLCLSLFSTEAPSNSEVPCLLDERARDELQSMVVNHLVNLSSDSSLGDEVFKEIVRSSMHSVMATCGVEHSRSEVQVLPPPTVCLHFDRVENGDRSLLKAFCSSCFNSFVKDVVKRILDTRLPHWLSLSL